MTQSAATKIETLRVPGANLYYEVRGSGPVLLMMPGGPADATAFRSIAGQLGPHYTVVTYDPRGLSRSRIVAGVGAESRGELAHDGGLGLAKRLGTQAVEFPGAHTGFESHTAEFAAKLREVLG